LAHTPDISKMSLLRGNDAADGVTAGKEDATAIRHCVPQTFGGVLHQRDPF
jgi:hypothetical protein